MKPYPNNDNVGIYLSRGVRTAGFSDKIIAVCQKKGWHLIGDLYVNFANFKKQRGINQTDAREVRQWFDNKNLRVNE